MYAIDLDGDGKNEVLTGLVAHGFGLAYYKATNAEATQFEKVDIMTNKAETSPVGLAVSQLHAVALGDMNGDGLHGYCLTAPLSAGQSATRVGQARAAKLLCVSSAGGFDQPAADC